MCLELAIVVIPYMYIAVQLWLAGQLAIQLYYFQGCADFTAWNNFQKYIGSHLDVYSYSRYQTIQISLLANRYYTIIGLVLAKKQCFIKTLRLALKVSEKCYAAIGVPLFNSG